VPRPLARNPWAIMQPRGLYAIVDVDATNRAGLAVIEFARAIVEAKPAMLQLRAKSLGARDYLALLEAVAPIARAARVPFIANDRPDLAWLAGCDGVHVGQTDLPVEAVRRFRRELVVGISTHNRAQMTNAFESYPSYVAVGPIYETASKLGAESSVGLELLREAQQIGNRTQIPVVAIGGITLERAKQLRNWAEYAAVIAALIPKDGRLPTATRLAEEFHATLCER